MFEALGKIGNFMAKLNINMIDDYLFLQGEEDLWLNAIFVFDSSSLLYLYEYSDETKEEILQTLKVKFKDRLWIPNHVAYEYLKNRERVINSPINDSKKYNDLKNNHLSFIEESLNKISNKTKDLYKKIEKQDMHPHINKDIVLNFEEETKNIKDSFKVFSDSFNEEVDKRKSEIDILLKNDIVLNFLVDNVDVGNEYSIEKIFNIIEEAKFRFSNKIAPGWLDENDKIGIQRFADFIIWKQILEHSKDVNKSIILITNDLKIDWCHSVGKGSKKKLIRPAMELIKEMKEHTSNSFWMYSFKDFLYKSQTLIKSNITNKALEEIEEVSKKRVSPAKLVIQLLSNNGSLPTASTLNWGQRSGRNPNQAYIHLPIEACKSDFFPEAGIVFSITTDDNEVLTCIRVMENGKALTTIDQNQLGKYFRSRLGVELNEPIRYEDLKNHGRFDIAFHRIDEENYFMDFSGTILGIPLAACEW